MGNSSFPVTYNVLEMIKGSLYLFLISLITYYAGVLVWRDLSASTKQQAADVLKVLDGMK